MNVRARARVKDVQASGMVLAAVDKLRDASVAIFSGMLWFVGTLRDLICRHCERPLDTL